MSLDTDYWILAVLLTAIAWSMYESHDLRLP
jgi:hypothetical protein